MIEDRGTFPYPPSFISPPDYPRIQTALEAMNIEVAALREELLTLREERWDENLVLSGLIGGVILVGISVLAGLWVLSVIGVGLSAMAVVHQFGSGHSLERNRNRASQRNQD